MSTAGESDAVGRARRFVSIGELERAGAEYRKVMQARPDEIELLREFRGVLFHLGLLAEAISRYRSFLGSHPSEPGGWNDLGVLQFEAGDAEDAQKSFESALRLQPDNSDIQCNLATVLLDRGDRERAIACLQEVLRHRPEEVRAHFLLGIEIQDGAMTLPTGGIQVGQPLIVMRRTSFSVAGEEQQWKSRLEDSSEETLSIAVPTSGWQTMPLRKGTRIIVGFPGKDAFWGVVIKVLKFTRDNIPLVVVTHPSEFKRVQRRSHVRIPCSGVLRKIDILTPGPNSPEGAPRGDLEFEEQDISAAGIGFSTSAAVFPGASLKVEVHLDGTSRSFECRIVRKVSLERRRTQIGAAFVQLGEPARDLIAKFIHKMQLDLRRQAREKEE